MSARRARATLVAVTLTTVVAFGLAAPASAAVPGPAPSATVSSGATAAHLSGRDPFPKLTPAQILAKSAASAKAAKTVRSRTVMKIGGTTFTVDAVLTRTAGQAKVIRSTGGNYTVVRYGKALYLMGDLKFWVKVANSNKENPAFAPKIAGKWVQLTGSGGALQDLVEMTSLSSLTKDVAGFKATKRVAGTKVRGNATVGLSGTTDGTPAVLYVAATGVPYPLLMVANDRSLSTTYSDWNRTMKIGKPKPVINLPVKLLPAEVFMG